MTRLMWRKSWLAGVAAVALAPPAVAQEYSLDAQVDDTSVDVDGSGTETGEQTAPSQTVHHPVELGIFGGVMSVSKKHDLHEDDMPLETFKRFAPELGLRLSVLPIRYFGFEVEGAGLMSETVSDGESATLWTVRGHAIAQIPTKHVIPFAVLGGGALGALSKTNGDETDGALHFGIGAKFPLTDWLSARIDARDTIAKPHDDNDYPHHFEGLVGLAIGFGGKKPVAPPPPPADADGDGLIDSEDQCPSEFANTPTGCPIRDTDGDGKLDPEDECPSEAGTLPNGCPDLDPDKDEIPLPTDKCPDVAGIAPDGCPDLDPDQDGISGEADKCPQKPETINGFEDQDGCPDEVPERIKEFTGVIQGIQFDTGKATIRPASYSVLDRAAAVLKEFTSLRLEIVGHTDSTGSRDRNLELSKARALSVREYLQSQGVSNTQLESRGVGPDEPIDDNKTWSGRQKNRRIEFKILR